MFLLAVVEKICVEECSCPSSTSKRRRDVKPLYAMIQHATGHVEGLVTKATPYDGRHKGCYNCLTRTFFDFVRVHSMFDWWKTRRLNANSCQSCLEAKRGVCKVELRTAQRRADGRAQSKYKRLDKGLKVTRQEVPILFTIIKYSTKGRIKASFNLFITLSFYSRAPDIGTQVLKIENKVAKQPDWRHL